MFTEFKLNTSAKSIMGYHWKADAPIAVCCLIHGIAEHAGRYSRMADRMNAAGIATLSMDLRGHGCSAGKRGHCAPRKDILEDVSRLIEYAEKTYPGVPLVLYGHSLGGNIVLDYRVRGELSGTPFAYVVSSPWLRLVRKIPKAVYCATKALARVKPDFALSAGINPENLGNPEMLYKGEREALLHNSISAQAGIEGYEIGDALLSGNLPGPGYGTTQPLLLMHGSGDLICSPEASRSFAEMQGKRCTYIEWEGFFHEIHNGNKSSDGEEVIERIILWIKATLG